MCHPWLNQEVPHRSLLWNFSPNTSLECYWLTLESLAAPTSPRRLLHHIPKTKKSPSLKVAALLLRRRRPSCVPIRTHISLPPRQKSSPQTAAPSINTTTQPHTTQLSTSPKLHIPHLLLPFRTTILLNTTNRAYGSRLITPTRSPVPCPRQ